MNVELRKMVIQAHFGSSTVTRQYFARFPPRVTSRFLKIAVCDMEMPVSQVGHMSQVLGSTCNNDILTREMSHYLFKDSSLNGEIYVLNRIAVHGPSYRRLSVVRGLCRGFKCVSNKYFYPLTPCRSLKRTRNIIQQVLYILLTVHCPFLGLRSLHITVPCHP